MLKNELIERALDIAGITGISRDPSDFDMGKGIRALEPMVASWKRKDLCLNYNVNLSTYEFNEKTGLDDSEVLAVTTNLALNLLRIYGKTPTAELMRDARETFNDLFPTEIPEREANPLLPVGQGNQCYGPYSNRSNRYFHEDEKTIDCDTKSLELGTIGSGVIEYDLQGGETILSHILESTNGIEITNDIIAGNKITYNVKGIALGIHTMTIKIVTSLSTPDFSDVERVQFNVVEVI